MKAHSEVASVIVTVKVGAKESICAPLVGTGTCSVRMKSDTEVCSLPSGLLLRAGGLSTGEPCL